MSVITLRLPDDLKQRLAAMAESRGESLNHLLESIAVQALVADETTRRILGRRRRGQREKALSVLDRVPSRPPILDEPIARPVPRSAEVRAKAAPAQRSRAKKTG